MTIDLLPYLLLVKSHLLERVHCAAWQSGESVELLGMAQIFTLLIFMVQAAGGIISASLLSTPGASGFYKGGLTVRLLFPFPIALSITDNLMSCTLWNHV